MNDKPLFIPLKKEYFNDVPVTVEVKTYKVVTT